MTFKRAVRDFAARTLGVGAFSQVNHNYLRLKYRQIPRIMNLRSPSTFTEKIVWLKMNYRAPLAKVVADKYKVREFVSSRVGDDILVPLHAVYDQLDAIDFLNLPERFVIKPNHGSGMVEFCVRDSIDEPRLLEKLRAWMEIDYGQLRGEYQYEGLCRKILVETDLRELAGSDNIPDYKFFCFEGEPLYVQVDVNRFSGHKRNFYDMDWSPQEFRFLYPPSAKKISTPDGFEYMKLVARKLSQGMPFARVDLYEVSGRVFFGEITLHPEGGVGFLTPSSADRRLGALIKLPSEV